jgi:peptidyl-prolyl cis-trans isomerase C
MADGLMRRPRLTVPVLGGMVGAAFLAAGCDKLPWSKEPAHAAPTTAQSGVVPGRPVVAPGDVVATINGVNISKQDVEFRVQELKTLVAGMNRSWTPLTEDQLTGVVDELVNNELMSQDAVARGLDRSTETQRRWEFLRRSFFVQEWVRAKQGQLEVASTEVEEYYEKNKLGFRVPERRKLRQISVASEEQAKRALARLLGEAADFAALAKEMSLAPTAAQGGLIPGWVMRTNEKTFLYRADADAAAADVTSLDPSLEAAAFAIDQVAALSSYVKGSDNRFHIFQLVERDQERTRPLNEVWDQIKNFLLLQTMQRELDALKQRAKVETFPERLATVTQ